MAGAEVFGYIHELPRQAIEDLNKFYKTQRRDSTLLVIPEDVLHAFVELYFEYFDSQFPFLHPSRLEDLDLPWVLLLAVAAVGSHYSEIQGADEYNPALSDLLARAVELTHRRSSLATMCWDLIGKADKRRHSRQGELDNEAAWQAWITEESELRLATCVS
uniref:Xylanolytic transcriptional activator regulatory domain-containing protein n=1 Tax=Fusarium oxysporum (strain Fo5176) TaxID=660025 RepID=A0A0D2YHI4_FUSOF